MENHGILRWRNWSTVRKCQVTVTSIGFFLTAIPALIHGLQLELPKYNAIGEFLLWLGLTLFAPTALLGIPVSGPAVAAILMVVVNTFLCLVAGTIIGWLLSKLKRRL